MIGLLLFVLGMLTVPIYNSIDFHDEHPPSPAFAEFP